MKLRIFALVLSLVLALGCLVSCGEKNDGVNAVDTESTGAVTEDDVVTYPTVEGGTLSVSAEVVGDQLVASVSVIDNPGLAAFNLQLHYDNTKLLPVEIADSELVDPGFIASNIQQGPEVTPTLTFATAFYANPSDFTGDGVLFTMIFDILDGAAGETELYLVCHEGDNTNQKFDDISFALRNCIVDLG